MWICLLWIAQFALALAALFYLLQGYTLALALGLATAAVAVYRARTDNEWTTQPWRDVDD